MLDRIAMPHFDREQAKHTVCPIVARHILVSTASLPSARIDRAVKLTIGRTSHSVYELRLIQYKGKTLVKTGYQADRGDSTLKRKVLGGATNTKAITQRLGLAGDHDKITVKY